MFKIKYYQKYVIGPTVDYKNVMFKRKNDLFVCVCINMHLDIDGYSIYTKLSMYFSDDNIEVEQLVKYL